MRVFTLFLLLIGSFSLAQDEAKQRAIDVIAAVPEVADYLKDFPDWTGNAWIHEEGTNIWKAEFNSEEADDWLGYGIVNLDNEEVYESFVPKPLGAEVFEERKAKVEALVLGDAEVLARLDNVDLWEQEVEFNRYERYWRMTFYKGIEAVAVALNGNGDDDAFSVERVFDPKAFDEEKAQRNARDRAIELSWEAEGIGESLDGMDNWRVYAEQREGSRWTVEFATKEKSLFSALVDIEAWEVLEAQSGQ